MKVDKNTIEEREKYQKEQEKEVVVKLQKWQVEKLLGAARMGIWVEDWCFNLWCHLTSSADTHSMKWIVRVADVIDQIKNQTGIDYENKGYGNTGMELEIATMVSKKCKEFSEENTIAEEQENKNAST